MKLGVICLRSNLIQSRLTEVESGIIFLCLRLILGIFYPFVAVCVYIKIIETD